VLVMCDPPNNNVAGGVYTLGSTTSEVYTYFNPEGPTTRLHPYNVNDYGQNIVVSTSIKAYYNQTFPKVAIVQSDGKRFTLQAHALVDSDGRKITFELQTWTLVSAAVTNNGVTGQNLTWSSSFTVATVTVTYSMSTVVWSGSGLVTVDGLSFNVVAGDTKTTYVIKNWPFVSSGSRLIFATFVGSNGNAVGLTQAQAGDVGAKYTLGKATFTVPVDCYLANVLSTINSSMWIDGTSGDSIQALSCFAFAKSSSILYDPLSTLSVATSGAVASAISFLSLMAAMVLALLFA